MNNICKIQKAKRSFLSWAEQFYGDTWKKVLEITDETDSSYRW